jgi:hypothetical protein
MNPFDTSDPQSAKFRLGLRPALNWLLVITIFVAVAAAFDNWICDVVAAIILYFLLTSFLERRAIRFNCPGCKKVILSNTPWVCGACGEINRNTKAHSFLANCNNQVCGVEPKAYRCHHKRCGHMIYLTADHDDTNYASCLNAESERPMPDEPDERAEKVKTDSENIEDKEREIRMAELEEKLRKIREQSKEPKIKSKFEQKKEAFDDFFEGAMGMREYAQKKRAEAAEKYKNDPESLKRANEAIDEFIRRNI